MTIDNHEVKPEQSLDPASFPEQAQGGVDQIFDQAPTPSEAGQAESSPTADLLALARKRPVQIGGGVLLAVIAGGAFLAGRGSDNHAPERTATTTTRPATPTSAANQPTVESTPTATTIPSTSPNLTATPSDTETAPDVTGDTPDTEATPTSEWGLKSFVTSEDLNRLVDNKAVEKLYNLYPVLRTINSADFVLNANPEATTDKSTTDYQALLKKVYSDPELVAVEPPTPSFFEKSNFENLDTDPGIKDVDISAVAGFEFDMLFLQNVYHATSAGPAHLKDFANLATLDKTMRATYYNDLQEMQSSGTEHGHATISDVVVLGGFTDTASGKQFAVYAYKYHGQRTVSISYIIPSGDFYPLMPRGLESAVSVPIWGRLIKEGQTTVN